VSVLDRIERARRLVLQHGWNATAYQILNPGMELWFAGNGDAVVGFVRHRRTRVVAGAPVCAPDRLSAVVDEFEADATAHRERLCYFAAESRLESLPRFRHPRARVLLGAQPVWHPARLLEGAQRHVSLRAQVQRARNKGVTVTERDGRTAAADPQLARCLAEWLTTRGLPPLHFLVETRTLQMLCDRRVFVAARDGSPVAFLVATPIPCRRGWLIEQIARGRGACNGTSELLIVEATRALVDADAAHLTLGLAPLARRGVPADPAPPRWLRLLFWLLRAHARRFYNFDGLEAFKAKFQPDEWQPVYALSSSGHITPSTLYAIAGAFAQTSPLWLMTKAVARAAMIEARTLFGRGSSRRRARRARTATG
jgi:phosphatidylglycerol lysyltransferase